MNFIINRKCCLLRTYEFHYVLPKRYNQLVSAKSADVNSNWDKYITWFTVDLWYLAWVLRTNEITTVPLCPSKQWWINFNHWSYGHGTRYCFWRWWAFEQTSHSRNDSHHSSLLQDLMYSHRGYRRCFGISCWKDGVTSFPSSASIAKLVSKTSTPPSGSTLWALHWKASKSEFTSLSFFAISVRLLTTTSPLRFSGAPRVCYLL